MLVPCIKKCNVVFRDHRINKWQGGGFEPGTSRLQIQLLTSKAIASFRGTFTRQRTAVQLVSQRQTSSWTRFVGLKLRIICFISVGCNNVVCRKNRTCMVDQYMRAYCVDCKFHCPKLSKQGGPVCGADGVQYESGCHLRLQTCRQGKSIGEAYKGECIGE